MRMFLRINPEQNISKAPNYEYVSTFPEQVITVCPIPPFIEEVKCDCGEIATVFLNDEIYKCNICVKLLLPRSKLTQSSAISFPITKKTVKDIRFEWSANGEKWYNIWATKIETKRWDSLLRDIKNMILENKPLEIEGDYDQLRKK